MLKFEFLLNSKRTFPVNDFELTVFILYLHIQRELLLIREWLRINRVQPVFTDSKRTLADSWMTSN